MKTLTIEQVLSFPTKLDDLITLHRDHYSMREAIKSDFADMPNLISVIDINKPIRATVEAWIIVCIEYRFGKDVLQKTHFLVGENAERQVPWMTSDIRSVDFEHGLVLTNNSLYKLGKQSMTVERGHIFQICGTLNRWGAGQRLGVPPVFF